ncbi:MAG: hypothetical protein MRERV_28c014 [Mycoplasmataceae bacterium RV_VA103A]|nr:MAG: hypothetical protein MRERV_28c014 [Mycoplasmataceae bacterium RV_VA103A]
MVDWKGIHEDFDKEIYWDTGLTYQKLWEEWGFTPEQTRLWIEVGFTPRQCFQVIGWRNYNFAPQQAQAWIETGLESWEYKYALYAQSKNYNPLTINCEELKKEYHQTQNCLDLWHPSERICIRKTKKQLSISSATEAFQKEIEVVKIDEEQEFQTYLEISPKN